jgi:poly-gamma-glutamate synthesis protein (capsule biosynthesis protein)
MTGRGIDQVLPHPSEPVLYESYVRDARDYVTLAELSNGPIQRPVGLSYIWGAALTELERLDPDARIVNLETSITVSAAYWSGKGINYRMHPDNVGCLTAARIDCCTLANNHVLDWGYAGLEETLATLRAAGLRCAGAGTNAEEAAAPAVVDLGARGRVLVFAYGSVTSGIPDDWGAGHDRPGVNLLPDLSVATARRVAGGIARFRGPKDVVVASVHWGGNWGYAIPREQRSFAHALIDSGAVEILHGHSSHHAKGIEVYRGRPILYGCGDFLNDYEGIAGQEHYRGDLSLMYFIGIDAADGSLASLRIVPLQMRRFSLHRAARNDAAWVQGSLERVSDSLGGRFELAGDDSLTLRLGEAA